MRRPNAALAVPGDLNMKTGGYIYDRRLVDELRLSSHDVTHIELQQVFLTRHHQTWLNLLNACNLLPRIALSSSMDLRLVRLIRGELKTYICQSSR